jgi:hypothetical protein
MLQHLVQTHYYIKMVSQILVEFGEVMIQAMVLQYLMLIQVLILVSVVVAHFIVHRMVLIVFSKHMKECGLQIYKNEMVANAGGAHILRRCVVTVIVVGPCLT